MSFLDEYGETWEKIQTYFSPSLPLPTWEHLTNKEMDVYIPRDWIKIYTSQCVIGRKLWKLLIWARKDILHPWKWECVTNKTFVANFSERSFDHSLSLLRIIVSIKIFITKLWLANYLFLAWGNVKGSLVSDVT